MKRSIQKALFVSVPAVLILASGIWLYIHQKRQPDKSRNVILVIVDALRADYLSCYGHPKPTTPHIDEFARNSSLFLNAFCPLPSTQPSLSSILTSLYPPSHGVRRQGVALSNKAVTLTEILRSQGWDTGAAVGASNLDTIFGFSQGFHFYEDHLGSKENLKVKKLDQRTRWQRKAKEVNEIVFRWLEKRDTQKPFFLMIHYFDPHAPYEPPPPYYRLYPPGETAESRWRAMYAGEVRYVDHQFGRLMKRLRGKDLLKNTLVILTADHGESLGEHNWQGHSQRIHDEAVRIPLIISGPEIPRGQKFSQIVQNVDFAPTILEFLNIPSPDLYQGKSIFRALEGKPLREFAYLEIAKRPPNFQKLTPDWQKFPETQWGVRTMNEKLIWSSDGKHEFYDLRKDPREINNVYSNHQARAKELEAIGKRIRSEFTTFHFDSGPQAKADDNDPDEALRALGYIN